MLRRAPRRAAGVSLIELMLALAILAILLTIGVPAFTTTLQNYQIRTAAEATISGLQLARNEALRRNASVRFQLTSSVDAGCNLSASGTSWVVSRNDPTAACDTAPVIDFLEPNDLALPQVISARNGQEGTPNVTFSATSGGAAATTVVFTPLGRTATGAIDTINLANPAGGTCAHTDPTNGKMRCLRVRIGGGGQVKLCDPSIGDATDPRSCS